MNCPVCGNTAYVKNHRLSDGRSLKSCQPCATEARHQLRAAAPGEVVGPDSRTRAQAVTAALEM